MKRYALQGIIGKGGAATVHLAKLVGDEDFERIVAVKRLRPDVAHDEAAVASFVEEAKLASRIRSVHVVPTLDVVVEDREVLLVMDYVAGETLSRLIVAAARAEEDLPVPVVAAIFSDVLRGLSAAHDAKAEDGTPLALVHRDVSPQNILVGTDGTARVVDFGIAKAIGRAQRTRTGMVKGKLGYMAPEQLQGGKLDARADVYATGVVMWEALTGERLFPGDEDDVVERILRGDIPPPSARRAGVSAEIDAVVLRAAARRPENRFASAREMLEALEEASPRATSTEVSDLVQRLAAASLAERARLLEECERAFVETTTVVMPPRAPSPKRRWPIVVAFAAVALVAVVAFAARRGSPPETVATMTPSSEPSGFATEPEDEEPPPSSSSSTGPSPRRPRPTRTTPRATSTSSSKKCNPPFIIDAEGHKQWKRECF